jgi:hypothetical protein
MIRTAIVFCLLLLFPGNAGAQAPVPYRWGEAKASTADGYAPHVIIVWWFDAEGQKRLAASKHKHDFYQLAHAFQPQANPVYATIASAVIVLNAMRQPAGKVPSDPAHEIRRPKALGGDILPYPAYSQSSFLNAKTDAIIDRKLILLERGTTPGLGLEDLAVMLQKVYGLDARVTPASEPNVTAFRRLLKRALADKTTFVLANFDGRVLGASTEGTVSPLAAYDESSDSVLILDVTGHKNPWYWVPLPALYWAMHTQYGDNIWRGYMTIGEAATSKTPTEPWQSCRRYFDGCNNCSRLESGKYACTRKYCPPEARDAPRCIER